MKRKNAESCCDGIRELTKQRTLERESEKKMARLAPKSARKYRDILKLANTICNGRRSWLHLCHDGKIVIVNQKRGNSSTGYVTLSRADFEKFSRFYGKAQEVSDAR